MVDYVANEMTPYNNYMLTRYDPYGMIKIEREGPGAIPKALQGWFTDPIIAQNTIDAYQKKKLEDANSKAQAEDEEVIEAAVRRGKSKKKPNVELFDDEQTPTE